MATTEQLPPVPGLPGDGDEQHEREFARKLAERYRFAFIDLREQRIDAELFRTIPADLMFRYNFVPLELQNNVLAIAAADPGQVQMSDELPLLLGKKLLIRVATARQIGDILKRTEQSQRVLEQATEAFTLQTSKEEEEGDETISGDRLTRDSSWKPSSSLHSSAAPAIFTSKRAIPRLPSNTASTECCNMPCSPSPRNGILRFSHASKC
jgi:type IV pilus assembly protein PilB